MPIWLRNFTFRSIKEYYDKEKEEYDKVSSKSKSPSVPLPKLPKPNYSTKARK